MAGWSLGRIWIKFPKGHPQHGLEVLMRRRLMREPDAAAFTYIEGEALDALSPEEQLAYVEALTEHRCAEFACLLIKWNFTEPVYDDKGEETGDEVAVPPTAEGVGRLDAQTFSALWQAYNEETSVVAPPLPQQSADGERSEVESTLPQETLSDSPPRLDTL